MTYQEKETDTAAWKFGSLRAEKDKGRTAPIITHNRKPRIIHLYTHKDHEDIINRSNISLNFG